MKDFFRKNLTIYHIIGLLFGGAGSFVYWLKVGQFSDYILKNNVVIVILWGMAIGYILVDLIRHSVDRME